MDIYNYDSVTGEFTVASTARPDPLEKDVFLIPANATAVAPPKAGANKRAVFNTKTGKWSLVPDFRGTIVFAPDGHSQLMLTTLGVALPTAADGQVIQLQQDGTAKAVPDTRGKAYFSADGVQMTCTKVGLTIPTPGAGQVVQQRGDGSFGLVPDLRGTVYFTAGTTADTVVKHVIGKIGESIPAGAYTSMPSLPPSGDMVRIELNRRLAAGVSVTLGGQTILAQADQASMARIEGWQSIAKYEVSQGNGAGTTAFRDATNATHPMTYADVEAFAAQIGGAVQVLIQKSWALKDANPIPSDYTDDSHW